jgi:molybdopterin-guanine dinucleotide biosynthesis protein B
MAKAVAFTGPSNSGKTTIIEKVAKELVPKMRVVVIKNDPKDKAVFDTEGKDSHRFYSTGADVIVTSPTRTTYFSHRSRDLEQLIGMAKPFDLLLVEGLKTLPLPRIAVFRGEADPDYFPYIKAVAVDESVDRSTIPQEIDILDLNDVQSIIGWIMQNAKEV